MLVLAEDESIAGEASMDEDDLTTGTHIRDQQIIDSESSYEVQVQVHHYLSEFSLSYIFLILKICSVCIVR